MREGNLVFWIAAVADVSVASAAAAWATRDRVSLARFVAAGALVAGLFVLKACALAPFGLDVFGFAHLLWLELVVALPAAGFVLVLRGRGGVRWAGIPLCLLALVGAYGTFVEPNRLEVERATLELPRERAGSGTVRVAVLADLQFEHVGPHEQRAVDRVMELAPDMILIPGDIHQGSAETLREELREIRRLLGRLDAPYGVFLVHGDAEGPAEAAEVIRGTRVRLLVNQAAGLRVRDRRITLFGTQLQWWKVDQPLDVYEQRPGRKDIRILLSHRPDAVLSLYRDSDERHRVDLTVAGHTHGGQIQLPLLGPIATASEVSRDVAAGGLHVLDGRPLYVSRGVGAERGQAPLVRLGAPPEISLLTLRDAPLAPGSFPIRKIALPQSGHLPRIASRPFFVFTAFGSAICTFLRSFTQ